MPDFQNERFIYLGDQANMPYGNYPSADRTDFLRELILKDAAFLLGRRYWNAPGEAAPALDKPAVKAIVIACNTATAYGLADIRAAAQAWGVPVITVGVVEAGARGLAETRGERDGSIAVFATVATCRSNAYPLAIERALTAQAPGIVQRGSVSLAAAIEGDPSVKQSIPEIIDFEVRSLLEEKKASGRSAAAVDTIVLGCTHYPLLRDVLTRTAAALAHRPVAIVDSATAMAEAAAAALGEPVVDRRGAPGALACFATDISRLDELAPRFLGEPVTSFDLVDL